MTQTSKILTLLTSAAVLTLGAVAAPVIMPSFGVPTASAQSSSSKAIVDAAKASGVVGEQSDGYLGLVTETTSAEIRAAVNDINIQRKTHYVNMAREKGESVDNVTKAFAIKIIERTPSGQKARGVDGRWGEK